MVPKLALSLTRQKRDEAISYLMNWLTREKHGLDSDEEINIEPLVKLLISHLMKKRPNDWEHFDSNMMKEDHLWLKETRDLVGKTIQKFLSFENIE